MKFEPEIVRNIMLDIEELHLPPKPFVFSDSEKFNRAKKYDLNVIAYHCDKLQEAGYLNWKPQYADNRLYMGFITGLTYDGHQFLDSVRSPKIWRETKTRAEKVGIFTLDFISKTASNIITEVISKQIQ